MRLCTSLADFPKIISRVKKAKECQDNWRWLFFRGNTWTWKTYQMRNFYEAMQENHLSVRRFTMIDFSINCRQSFSDNSPFHYDLEKYKKTSFLFIDDLWVEKATDYVVETLYSIVEYRYTRNLATFFTSNQSPEAIWEKYNQQMESRIREKCKIVHFAWEDKRKAMWPNF